MSNEAWPAALKVHGIRSLFLSLTNRRAICIPAYLSTYNPRTRRSVSPFVSYLPRPPFFFLSFLSLIVSFLFFFSFTSNYLSERFVDCFFFLSSSFLFLDFFLFFCSRDETRWWSISSTIGLLFVLSGRKFSNGLKDGER